MLPLPVPARGGSIETLASFCNIPSRSDFVLVVSWLLAALRHGGPYPILALSGEQGAAKTVLSKMLRALIDPNVAPVRSAPREERDLFIAANNGHLLAFDNVSDLPAWTSDALCRLASGGSFAVRRLYTDQDETLFQAARPVILNGIEDVITRPDVADRAIFVALPHIPEHRRRPEKELWHDFEKRRPQVLGALLDTASHGLRTLPNIRLEQLPRMADFAYWASACETVICSGGGFLQRIGRTAGPPSKMLSRPIQLRCESASSWRNAHYGPAALPTCCAWELRSFLALGSDGRRPPARSRAVCDVPRSRCGSSESRLALGGRDMPGRALSPCGRAPTRSGRDCRHLQRPWEPALACHRD